MIIYQYSCLLIDSIFRIFHSNRDVSPWFIGVSLITNPFGDPPFMETPIYWCFTVYQKIVYSEYFTIIHNILPKNQPYFTIYLLYFALFHHGSPGSLLFTMARRPRTPSAVGSAAAAAGCHGEWLRQSDRVETGAGEVQRIATAFHGGFHREKTLI